MKKLLSVFAALVLVLNLSIFVSAQDAPSEYAVYSKGNITFTGSGMIKGNTILDKGHISGNEWMKTITGVVYATEGSKVSGNLSSTQIGSTPATPIATYSEVISADYFADCEYSNGSKNLVIGWGGTEKATNYTLSGDAYINKLHVNPTLNINIQTKAGETTFLRVNELCVEGSLTIVGGGNLVIYVDKTFTGSANGTLNAGSNKDNLTISFGSNVNDIKIETFKEIRGNIIANNANISMKNVRLYGSVYTAGNFIFTDSGFIEGMVYAPNSNTKIDNSCFVKGMVITTSLSVSGNAYIEYGPVDTLPEVVTKELTLDDGIEDEPTPEQPKEQEEPVTETPVTPEDGGQQPTEGGQDTEQPTDTEQSGGDNNSEAATGEDVSVTVVTPKRMSVRLEDGTVLKNGDNFIIKKGGTVKFQMCTNNWDTDKYTDDGNGIVGTKVYTYTNSKKDNNFLRTDTNTYFMAVRYHFKGGDYNKQTGIEKVLSTPLESLSVNLPLGSTITSDAYVNYKKIRSADVFVETAADKTICYTDFYWEK